MSILRDIAATYKGPVPVLRRRLSGGTREDRALAVLMAGCGLLFVAQWPRLAREAFVTDTDLEMLMGGSLMALMFILPLILYAIAGIGRIIARLVGGQGSSHAARIALFWALLAAAPVFLLDGLTKGFLGAGVQSSLTGLLALGVFLWFWLSGLWAVEKGRV